MNEKAAPINIDELLQKFVSADELRPKFLQPWRHNNHVFASETHILIRVNGNMTIAEYPTLDLNADTLFPTGTPDGIIALKPLEDALALAPMEDEMAYIGEDVDCDECDGNGRVDWSYRHWVKRFDCPKCFGTGFTEQRRKLPTGRKVIAKDAAIRIGPHVFRADFLNILVEAMRFCDCSQSTVTFGNPRSASLFNLAEGIDIILMPVNQDIAYTEITLYKYL